ncbi:argininosuccinate synthase [Candidatus Aerophobetes bacterium]|uniref:Argininosuccinate synthase n=1 Tax=Aerophobetes bacterium TaxID=2030807 RepID=A0A523RVG7_UNCAE|nr:MAG: argininosuccinate synthase [Candidatus Aerophobetes bacterium]
MISKIKKIVLAYSGGLDTSVILAWLKEKYKAEVITYTANLGQGSPLDSIEEKAKNTGASKTYVEDLRKEFSIKYILPALQAGAIYEGKYPLATALGRFLIAKNLVKIAEKEKAEAIAHGCSGKGNDQVRFEVTAKALNPEITVLAPLREWELTSREEEVRYAQKHNIPIEITEESPYSMDRNLWGISIECGSLEDVWQEPPPEVYQITASPEEAPGKPTYIEIEFQQGIPSKLDGKSYELANLIEKLNLVGGKNGVGRIDLVENRLIGIKSREIYEAPAAVILHYAHKELERLTLDKDTFHFKEVIAQRYSQLVYNGLWYSPLRQALDGFVTQTQKFVSGQVKLKLYKGSCEVVARKSPYSLYDKKLATYSKEDVFNQKASEGFIHIWGLPLKTVSKIRKKKEKK